MKDALLNEIKHEAANTRKMLERLPDAKLSWTPHPKSRPLMNTAKHIATIYNWIPRILGSTEIDMAKGMPAPAPDFTTNAALLAMHDNCVSEAIKHLEAAPAESLGEMWTFRNGDHVFFTLPKAAVIRNMAMNHLVHHRGQLSVYLRLLDLPVPGIYGPSADEQ